MSKVLIDIQDTNSPKQVINASSRLARLRPQVEKYKWHLIWLNGKRPVEREWPKKATSDISTLMEWARLHPTANWGVACGPNSDLIVIDVDGTWGLEAVKALEAKHGLLPGPRVVTGSGNLHLYFRYDTRLANGYRVSCPGEKGELLVSGGGRQIVAPGSIHPESGHTYEWAEGSSPEERSLAYMPDWFVDWMLGNKNPPTASSAPCPAPVPPELDDSDNCVVGRGERNHELHAYICQRVYDSLNAGGSGEEDSLWVDVERINAEQLDPPFPPPELHDRYRRSVKRAREDWASSRQEPKKKVLKASKSTEKQGEIVWHEPVDFEPDSGPAFPDDVFDGCAWIANIVRSVANTYQVPSDLPSVLALAAVAGSCQRSTMVSPREGWLEPIGIYVAVAMEPGSNKSQVHGHLFSPVYQWEQELNLNSSEQRRAWAARRKVLLARIAKLEKKAGDVEDRQDQDQITGEISEMMRELEDTPEGQATQAIYDDSTSEAIQRGMAANGGVAIIASSEGRVFEMMAGASSEGKVNIDVYLKAHSGDPVRVNRISREHVFLECPRLTIAVACQPDVIAGLAAKREFAGRGLLARLLFVIPRGNVGNRSVDAPPVDPKALAEYQNQAKALLTMGWDGTARVVKFSDEASQVFQAFRAATEPWLNPNANDLHGMAGWASKLAGHVARLSGVLHIAENPEKWPEIEVGAKTVERAVKIADYLIAHAAVAFGLMRADPVQQDARYLLRHLIQLANRFKAPVKRHDLWQAVKRHFKTAEALDASLTMLESRHYLVITRIPGHGAKPSEIYHVNPALLSTAETSGSKLGNAR